MSHEIKSNALSVLQPDLLTVEELVRIIESGSSAPHPSTSLPEGGCLAFAFIPDCISMHASTCSTPLRMPKRCCRAENLRLMSKEGLVGLFRRVVLPLPQRLYRTNRRGKMLTARRARAGLGSDRKEQGSSSGSKGRLKPPPDIHNSQGQRINSGNNGATDRGQSRGIKDTRNDAATSRCKSPSEKRVTLKRPSSDAEKLSGEGPVPINGKRQRTVIKWP